MSSTDDRAPFERQPGEPAKAYHGFCHYRDAGPMRSLDKAWRQHHAECLKQVQPETKRRPMAWGNWSVRWGWVERAGEYDRHLEQKRRTALLDEQAEAAKRHARVLQAAISTVTLPVRIALETAATPGGLEKLRAAANASASGLRTAIAEARLSAAHLPALVASERLVLGMSTDYLEVGEKPLFDAVAERIVRDPKAVSIAVQLVDQLARPAADDKGNPS
jgi:phosphoribosylcarboxyaminoimidazole (NCAIR) mutase